MISINDYINNIFQDFSEYVKNSEKLCDLNPFTFEAGYIPDYSNIHIQQLYLLRYAFAYAFEYKRMYSKILKKLNIDTKLKITSFGCGPMIDYWSLCNACEEHSFEYIGIDIIDWNYKFESQNPNPYRFIKDNMIEYIKELKELDSDIYFFPKSICEIKNDDLTSICDSFRTKRISKDKIILGISLRADVRNLEIDACTSEKIANSIIENGFICKSDLNKCIHFEESHGIRKFESSFIYPDEAKSLLDNLYNECSCSDEDSCEEKCREHLNRQPVLRTDNIRYQILEFERTK